VIQEKGACVGIGSEPSGRSLPDEKLRTEPTLSTIKKKNHGCSIGLRWGSYSSSGRPELQLLAACPKLGGKPKLKYWFREQIEESI